MHTGDNPRNARYDDGPCVGHHIGPDLSPLCDQCTPFDRTTARNDRCAGVGDSTEVVDTKYGG